MVRDHFLWGKALQVWLSLTVTGLRSVLGLFNFSRIYISDFSDLARPLTEALKGGFLCVTPLEWTLEMDESFSLLKSAPLVHSWTLKRGGAQLLKLYAFKSALTIVSDEIECNHVNISQIVPTVTMSSIRIAQCGSFAVTLPLLLWSLLILQLVINHW